MTVFPIFVNLADRPCLVVGAGPVGRDKASRLVEAGARVLLVDPVPSAMAIELASAKPLLVLESRPFRDHDCDGRTLVFACTDNEAVNEAVSRASLARGVLCCRSDGAAGDFTTGALLRRGELCVAVSSGGASPSLARAARDEVTGVIGDEYAEAARMLASLRSRLREDVADPRARGKAMRAVLHGADTTDGTGTKDDAGTSDSALAAGLLELLRRGRHADAQALVDQAHAAALPAAASAQGSPCTR